MDNLEEISDLIRSVFVFLLMETLLIRLLPDAGFQKLFRITCGLILTGFILRGILIFQNQGAEAEDRLQYWQEVCGLQQYREAAGQPELEDFYRTEAETLMKERITNLVAGQGYVLQSIGIRWDEEGNPTELQLEIGKQADGNREFENGVELQPVQIQPVDISIEEETETQDMDDPSILAIRNELMKTYHLGEEAIGIRYEDA